MSSTPPIPPSPPIASDEEGSTRDFPDAPQGRPVDRAAAHNAGASGFAGLARYVDWGLKLFSLAIIPLFVWIWQHDRSDIATLQRLDTIERDMIQLRADTKEQVAKLEAGVDSCEDRQAGIAVLENELGHLQAGISDIKLQLSRLHGSNP